MQIETNQDRLWSTLMELGKLGETDKGGCNRVEFTVLNKEARDRFCSWARDAGCQILIDGFGNIRARRQGKNPGCTDCYVWITPGYPAYGR